MNPQQEHLDEVEEFEQGLMVPYLETNPLVEILLEHAKAHYIPDYDDLKNQTWQVLEAMNLEPELYLGMDQTETLNYLRDQIEVFITWWRDERDEEPYTFLNDHGASQFLDGNIEDEVRNAVADLIIGADDIIKSAIADVFNAGFADEHVYALLHGMLRMIESGSPANEVAEWLHYMSEQKKFDIEMEDQPDAVDQSKVTDTKKIKKAYKENRKARKPPKQTFQYQLNKSFSIPQTSMDQLSNISPQDCGCGGTGISQPLGYVFAIGNLQPTFPNASLQQEFQYAYGQTSTNFPVQTAFYDVLSQPQYFYLAEQLCWVFQVGGIDTFIVQPRTEAELYYFIDSLDPQYMGQERYDVIVGTRGPIAGPDACNGLQLPVVTCDISYHFTFSMFVDYWVNTLNADPNPPQTDPASLQQIIQDTLQQLLNRSLTEGEGASDSSRVLNFLITRVSQVYLLAVKMQQGAAGGPMTGFNYLNGITIQPSQVAGNRVMYDVLFEYANKVTLQSTYWYLRVDVTGVYPFLVTNALTQYFPQISI